REIATLAAHQHGVAARRQLQALGLSRSAVGRHVTAGRLHRIHRGVYAVGHPRLTLHGHWMAAVLAAGPGAALSHASAAALWEIRASAAARIDVSVPSAAGRAKQARVRVHRTRRLRRDEVTVHQAIPVTTPARTLLDLASSLPRRPLERALDQAEILELFDLRALQRVIDAHRGERGARALAAALEDHHAGTTVTRSALEESFLALCAAQALERPQANVRVCGLEVDFLFAAQKLVVELDGYRFHRSRRAFERDRERDAILARHGLRVLRFSHHQVTRRPAEVAAAIRSSA
ncbi:MAG TPA: type IV toxin-antitoxin system AbiEi family antitoxin domain-containing protein, partial [Solirubrobacteraceae bacterium]